MPTRTIFEGESGVRDTFTFQHQQGVNKINDFQPGQDRLEFKGFSPHEVRYSENANGDVDIHAGGLAGFGVNHTEVTLTHVHPDEIRGHISSNGDIWFG